MTDTELKEIRRLLIVVVKGKGGYVPNSRKSNQESQLKRGKRGRNEFRAASLLPPVWRKANRQPRRVNSRQTQANQCRVRRPDQDLSLLLRGGLSPGEARCGVELGGWKSVSSAVQTAG